MVQSFIPSSSWSKRPPSTSPSTHTTSLCSPSWCPATSVKMHTWNYIIYCGIGVFVFQKSAFLFSSLQQFVEIKGSVFKKFGKSNLFQMSNSGKIFRMGNNLSWSTCSSCYKWKIYSFFILCILMKSEKGKCGLTQTALKKPINFTPDVEHIVLFYCLIPCSFISFLFIICRH